MAKHAANGTARKASQPLAVNTGTSWRPLSGWALSWAQFAALMKKFLIVRRRAWKINLLLVAQAVLFMALTWCVDRAVSTSNQRRPAFSTVPTAMPQSVGPVPDCNTNMFLRQDIPCYTLLYAPQGIPIVDSIISAVIQTNGISDSSVRGFKNSSEIDAFLRQNPNALAAVEFIVENPTNVGFTIQTNSSTEWFKGRWQDPNQYIQLPVQVAIEREMVKAISQQPNLEWDVAVTQFPHPPAKSPSAIANFLPTFIFSSLMFQFVLQLHDILHEKESGAKRMMKIMGLKSKGPFWASWIVSQSFLAVIEACLIVGFAYAFRFDLHMQFVRNDFLLSFLLILGVSLAMTSFGFFVAAFLKKASAAVPVGFFLFVVAWVFLVVLRFGFPFHPKYSQASRLYFASFPWTLLGKGIDDLAEATSGPIGGLAWEDREAYCQIDSPSPLLQQTISFFRTNCVMPLSEIYIMLGVQTITYLLMALYLDDILPDENGTKRAPWYLLQPSYWFPSMGSNKKAAQAAIASLAESENGMDADVQSEQDRLTARCEAYIKGEKPGESSSKYAVEMYGLRRTFKRGGLFNRGKDYAAVAGTWLGIKEGECFCLLGPNGAGKTTTIHCLTGILPFSGGDALMYDCSIARTLDPVRSLVGVCPQFDTGLWELLTGREHLSLFASIKGIPAATRAGNISQLLEDVKLTEAAENAAGTYSGGMKRRLSVAMALLGDPKIVFLDEPTTGLDPISRRHLWDLIDKVKQNRAIILTTHSMEEADILGDRIGIMVRGRLQCVGTSLRLKSRFGSGYRVSVRVESKVAVNDEDQKVRVKALFSHRLGVKSVDETHDYVHFLVPYENEDRLPLMLAHIKAHAAEIGVRDVQLRLTPLEEVFLNVTQKAELAHAEAKGKFETLILVEENITIKVPIGAEFIQSPSGQFYHVKWVQDESGALKLQDYRKDPLNAQLSSDGQLGR